MALNHIMEELLQQLGKEENLHLVSESTGRVMMIMTGTQNYLMPSSSGQTLPILKERMSLVFLLVVYVKNTHE